MLFEAEKGAKIYQKKFFENIFLTEKNRSLRNFSLLFLVEEEMKSVETERLVEMYTKYFQFIGYLVEMCPGLLPKVSNVGGIGKKFSQEKFQFFFMEKR